jgi:hypothetical protein
MPSKELKNLYDLLEKWKAHNEVNAKPADGILYDFLNGVLDLAGDEQELETQEEKNEEIEESSNESGEGGEGGNSPSLPPDLP